VGGGNVGFDAVADDVVVGGSVLVEAGGGGLAYEAGVVVGESGEGCGGCSHRLGVLGGVVEVEVWEFVVEVGRGGGERVSAGNPVVYFEGGDVAERFVGGGVIRVADALGVSGPLEELGRGQDADAAVPKTPKDLD